jgi:hypothetical protein
LLSTFERKTAFSAIYRPKRARNRPFFLPFLAISYSCEGDLPCVPPVEAILETAHVLPGKANQAKPIICRFTNRDIKATIFKHKKEFAPREIGGSRPHGRASRYLYLFFDDLKRTNFSKMRALAADERVSACWTSNGVIKYKLVDSQEIKKVSCVFDSVDKILC